MPPEERGRASAAEWLRHAQSNLAHARQLNPAEVLWEHLCFDGQQAAEKAVKAVLVLRGIDFSRSHDIGELLEMLVRAGHEIPDGLRQLDDLSDYAVDTRYPGLRRPVDEDEYRKAVALAERAVRWAESVLRGVGAV